MDYLTLKQQVLNEIKNDNSIKIQLSNLQKKINAGTATYQDVTILSKRLGGVTASKLKANSIDINAESLGAYADEVLLPIYSAMQSTSIVASKQVQRIYNKKAGFGLEPAEVSTDVSRLKHIAKRFKEASDFEDVSFLIGQDVAENIARGAVIDSLKANAEQFEDAGIETYVTRDGVGCCEWCESMTGVYEVSNVNDDFWRVHKNCTCTFEYKTRNKRTRITYSTSDDGKLTKNTTKL